MEVPYTDAEADDARQWSNRHGPPNAWSATAGTAARMIGRLLDERERLMARETVMDPGDDYIREWHDEFQRWKAVSDAKEDLRDHFAAAALTGLLAQTVQRDRTDYEVAELAFVCADAMLRERGRTNHDAVPAARASDGRPRTDKADLPTRSGAGNTPVTEPMPKEKRAEVSETLPVPVANLYDGRRWILADDYLALKREYWNVKRQQPTLTDAEREAVEFAAERLLAAYVEEREIALTLRGLLERLK